MIFLLVLAISTATTAMVTSLRQRFSAREAARIGMAIALAFAGASHVFLATPFIQHLPTWVPLRAEIVLVSGLAEIALGIALLLPPRLDEEWVSLSPCISWRSAPATCMWLYSTWRSTASPAGPTHGCACRFPTGFMRNCHVVREI